MVGTVIRDMLTVKVKFVHVAQKIRNVQVDEYG
jgi:hypothetical protein